MTKRPRLKGTGIVLEAEVALNLQADFQQRYQQATGNTVSPGHPAEYQSQPNKWGAELRFYFNDPDLAEWMQKQGLHVEERQAGYRSGAYTYRVNDNETWWNLVEHEGLRLGAN